jgi:hypothetical protein
LERAYWRRKLPAAFKFYLEMLCRDLMLAQPPDTYDHAAKFFEELLLQVCAALIIIRSEHRACTAWE